MATLPWAVAVPGEDCRRHQDRPHPLSEAAEPEAADFHYLARHPHPPMAGCSAKENCRRPARAVV